MPTPPSLANVKAYLGSDHGWSDEEIDSALASEIASQARRCRLPADPIPAPPAVTLEIPNGGFEGTTLQAQAMAVVAPGQIASVTMNANAPRTGARGLRWVSDPAAPNATLTVHTGAAPIATEAGVHTFTAWARETATVPPATTVTLRLAAYDALGMLLATETKPAAPIANAWQAYEVAQAPVPGTASVVGSIEIVQLDGSGVTYYLDDLGLVRTQPPVLVGPYPLDLAEALCRRVAHNLALRGLPLGLQSTVTAMGAANTRVGGLDAEVLRLEAPYRRLGVG